MARLKRPWETEEFGTVIQSHLDKSLIAVVIWNYGSRRVSGKDLLFINSFLNFAPETVHGFAYAFEQYKVLPKKQLKIIQRRNENRLG